MAEPLTFWQRVRRLFQPVDASPGGEARPSGTNLNVPVAAGEAKAAPAGRRWLAPPAARDASLRLIELVDAMQWHFQRQDERAAGLSSALDRMGSVLEQLAETQHTQSDTLRSIAAHGESVDRHSLTVADTLGRIPDSLLAQAEAIRTIARQMGAAQESDKLLVQSLQQFGHAVDTLGSAGSAQVEALQRLNSAQGTQHDAFATAVREQNRRFLVVTMVFGALTIAALAAVCIILGVRLSP